MTWPEFKLARLLMAEERVGSRLRAHDRGELDQDAETRAILESRGMVG